MKTNRQESIEDAPGRGTHPAYGDLLAVRRTYLRNTVESGSASSGEYHNLIKES